MVPGVGFERQGVLAMQIQGRWLFGLVIGLLSSLAAPVQAQSWKPALRDADKLYHAAETLHDRSEHFRDHHTLAVTARLEHLTEDLYQLLKHNACAAEVSATLNAAGSALELVSSQVMLSCQLREDRRAQTELANAQASFECAYEHIQCALRSAVHEQPVYRAPVWQAPSPSQYAPAPHGHGGSVHGGSVYGVPQPQPRAFAPYGYEVQYQHAIPQVRGLARVRISGVY